MVRAVPTFGALSADCDLSAGTLSFGRARAIGGGAGYLSTVGTPDWYKRLVSDLSVASPALSKSGSATSGYRMGAFASGDPVLVGDALLSSEDAGDHRAGYVAGAYAVGSNGFSQHAGTSSTGTRASDPDHEIFLHTRKNTTDLSVRFTDLWIMDARL